MNSKHLSFVLLFSLLCSSLFAQNPDTLNQTASPFGGVNELALHYFSIDFTKEQRQQLKDVPIEFIFLVDEKGTAKLREINGIQDIVILDSLERHSNELPKFQPALEAGQPISSLYFMQLTFPTYKPVPQRLSSSLFGVPVAALSEFEYIEFSKDRLDLVVGFTGSTVFGNAKDYLKGGFGMFTKFSYTTKSTWGVGLNFGFDINNHKRDFPIEQMQTIAGPSGINRFVVVVISAEGNESYVLKMKEKYPGKIGIITLLDPFTSNLEQKMELNREKGILGYRLNSRDIGESWLKDTDKMWQIAADLDVSICLLA